MHATWVSTWNKNYTFLLLTVYCCRLTRKKKRRSLASHSAQSTTLSRQDVTRPTSSVTVSTVMCHGSHRETWDMYTRGRLYCLPSVIIQNNVYVIYIRNNDSPYTSLHLARPFACMACDLSKEYIFHISIQSEPCLGKDCSGFFSTMEPYTN